VGKIEGTVLFAGHKTTKQFLRRFSSYVEQFDTLIPNLTVSEVSSIPPPPTNTHKQGRLFTYLAIKKACLILTSLAAPGVG